MGQEIHYDEEGNVTTASLMDYFLPTAVETPHWETDWTTTPSPHHPIGAKGVGESPNVGGVPCFANAVNDAFAFLGTTTSRCRTTTGAPGRRRRSSGCMGEAVVPGRRCSRRAPGSIDRERADVARIVRRYRCHGFRDRGSRARHDVPRMTRAMTLDREAISDRLAAVGYIADRDIATALWLMEFLKRPLLLEGEAGVGKTEVAKALAAVHGAELIRLQCYEGLDQNAALYEWNYQRQLLAIKTREGVGENADAIEEHIFSERYPARAAAARRDPAREAAGAAGRRGRPRRRGVRGVPARAAVRLPGEHSGARHDQGRHRSRAWC